ncbi:MAG: hypothetical protein AVDCRST_MAG56-7631 [uncultured Cytophagales bacterium]|uniref:Uncharacterized protein n=1 Tax=uncultured Cytophagales bacterium TaxID=158755 RepID=A0A6J4LIY7_9SPHI|nr:MAG: hypothetical protein AVDCRST_MAG56-7631 [uncultured Cytophagales bacterium]
MVKIIQYVINVQLSRLLSVLLVLPRVLLLRTGKYPHGWA